MIVPVFLKPEVDLSGITHECVRGLLTTVQVYASRGVTFGITSVGDGKHGPRSLHYKGRAFDCRLPSRYTGHVDTDAKIVADLKEALGAKYDVVLESDHIHVEYDPK